MMPRWLLCAVLVAGCSGGSQRPPQPYLRIVPAAGTYAVCWKPSAPGGGSAERMELRLRAAADTSLITVPVQSWRSRPDGFWCSPLLTLPAAGSYWYEARACADQCASWVSSLDIRHAEIAGRPRAWRLEGRP